MADDGWTGWAHDRHEQDWKKSKSHAGARTGQDDKADDFAEVRRAGEEVSPACLPAELFVEVK